MLLALDLSCRGFAASRSKIAGAAAAAHLVAWRCTDSYSIISRRSTSSVNLFGALKPPHDGNKGASNHRDAGRIHH